MRGRAELSLADTADNVQAALVLAIGSASVLVTNPQDGHFRIEFVNQLAASRAAVAGGDGAGGAGGRLYFHAGAG